MQRLLDEVCLSHCTPGLLKYSDQALSITPSVACMMYALSVCLSTLDIEPPQMKGCPFFVERLTQGGMSGAASKEEQQRQNRAAKCSGQPSQQPSTSKASHHRRRAGQFQQQDISCQTTSGGALPRRMAGLRVPNAFCAIGRRAVQSMAGAWDAFSSGHAVPDQHVLSRARSGPR